MKERGETTKAKGRQWWSGPFLSSFFTEAIALRPRKEEEWETEEVAGEDGDEVREADEGGGKLEPDVDAKEVDVDDDGKARGRRGWRKYQAL